MAETQREPVPRNDDGEADTTLAFLTFARHCVIKKTEGLSEEELRRPVVESGTSLLGLVWHLIDAERYWFGYQLAGEGVDDYEFEMKVPDDVTSAHVIAEYRDAIAESDAILTGRGKPHPAAYGTFPRVLGHFVRNRGLFSLEEPRKI